MKIKPFEVEEWMNAYETGAKFNIAETCVNSVSLDELFELTGADKQAFLSSMCSQRLTYGYIEGAPELKNGICKLYKTLKPEEIVTTHGASGANHHIFYSLVEPGDRIISIMPTYQQLYSIPESFGADLKLLHLSEKNGFLPDLDELRAIAVPGTKMICINNPNNPTGALMTKDMLMQIVEIAKSVGSVNWMSHHSKAQSTPQTGETCARNRRSRKLSGKRKKPSIRQTSCRIVAGIDGMILHPQPGHGMAGQSCHLLRVKLTFRNLSRNVLPSTG